MITKTGKILDTGNDPEGKIKEIKSTSFGQKRVEDLEAVNLLLQILNELQTLNLHMQAITDEEF